MSKEQKKPKRGKEQLKLEELMVTLTEA